MAIIPLTKMIMLNDNRKSSNIKLSAEYDLFKKEWNWYEFGNEAVNKQKKSTNKLLIIGSFISPLFIVPIISLLGGYTDRTLSPSDRLPQFHNWAPVLVGLLLFIVFATLTAYRPKGYIKCTEPGTEVQLKYFNEVYEFSIKHNNAVGEYKTPYLVNILSFGMVILCIPVTFRLYNQPDTVLTFLLKMIVFGTLIAVVMMGIWAIIIKAIIIKRKINTLKNEIEEELE